jgi:hypothetical protein
MGGILGSYDVVVLKSFEGFGNISWYRYVHSFVDVVPSDCHGEVQWACPVHCDDVKILECHEKMVGVAAVIVFDSKVIYHEAECDIACVVGPNAWGMSAWCVSMWLEVRN